MADRRPAHGGVVADMVALPEAVQRRWGLGAQAPPAYPWRPAPHFNVLGVRVHPVNLCEAVRHVHDLVARNGKGYITVTGVHGIVESQRSPSVRRAHNDSFLTVPDGMPLVYIGRGLGHRSIDRCYGPELMRAILAASVDQGYTHFLYGGKRGIAEELRDRIERAFPGVCIVGTHSPPFRPLTEGEAEELMDLIARVRPTIFWVGLSTPKQEVFMHEFLPSLETNVMVGVGAAFDILTGHLKSAPRIMQRLALEWFYRLLQEPRRLWKRYLINNPLFLWMLSLQILGVRGFGPGRAGYRGP